MKELKTFRKFLNEGTCGYTPDGKPRSKPAAPIVTGKHTLLKVIAQIA